ncbi:DUF6249 domain-containing protein [Bacteroides sp. 51]|uniref:DUF6249 domain-containing protein n=1 Tax=Bacteroides sp. 51 TaxID=2302938 RepID=UPI0013D4CECD|nr:DUF6249 domain-containing protein [Bacteroides sp. 51]NDV82434.1 hypothetical protein [Bacteroides sp. 51]
MKRITLLLIAIIACLITVAAQVDTSAVQQSVTDTQIEYTDTPDTNHSGEKSRTRSSDFFSDFSMDSAMAIPIIAIVCTFGMPVLIVFIAFYFKYKNRRAKYKLAEQALAAGQPIPEDFFKTKAESGTLQKGITNTFTGVGLFIFLWAITGEFSIGCIGLLIMFMGLGQIVIHYTQDNKKNNKKDRYNDDNNISIEE